MASAVNFACGLLFLLCNTLLIIPNHYYSVSAQHEDEIPKVGIIGGGLAGTSAAYYLRQLFGDKLQVDVIEGERIGGRVALINIDGQDYEAGGTIIHPRNAYMVNFTEQLGLEKQDVTLGTLGLFNSKDGLFFQTSTWKAVTLAKLFWRYGWDLKLVDDKVAGMLDSFSRIYDYQNRGMAFTTVEDLLKAMSESFVNLTRISGRTFLKDAGFSDAFVDELATGALRNNYGQTPEMHGFVTAITMAAEARGLWCVKGGNKNVAERLLKASGANFIQGKVTQIDQIKSEGGSVSYEVQYKRDEGKDDVSTREYDIVIMATPLQSGSKLKIKFEEFPEQFRVPDIPFHRLQAVFVQGRPNISFFGVENRADFPTNIMTTDTGVFFNSLGKLSPVTTKEGKSEDDKDDDDVWKLFFNKVPSDAEMQQLFSSRKDFRIVDWLAYPAYSAKMELPSFVLYDRLYFVNAIESAASAMEMSIIGARNVALLAYNQWFGQFDKIDELEFPSERPGSGEFHAGEGVKSDEL